jgi:hypothetical protein
MCGICRNFLPNQTQANTGPVDMHINWKQRQIATKEKHTRSRFGAKLSGKGQMVEFVMASSYMTSFHGQSCNTSTYFKPHAY